MFEYLMPSLWMKLYPNTLLEQAARTAVLAQRKYAGRRSMFPGEFRSALSPRNAPTDVTDIAPLACRNWR